MQLMLTMGGTVLVWAAILGALFLLRDASRLLFIAVHYTLNLGLFGMLAYLLRKAGVTYSTGWMVAVVVGALLVLELFYWKLVNPAGAARYLTLIDWVVPLILVMGTVYIVALFSK